MLNYLGLTGIIRDPRSAIRDPKQSDTNLNTQTYLTPSHFALKASTSATQVTHKRPSKLNSKLNLDTAIVAGTDFLLPARLAVFIARSFSQYHFHLKQLNLVHTAQTLVPSDKRSTPWLRIVALPILLDPAYAHFIANGLRISPFRQLPRADKHSTYNSNNTNTEGVTYSEIE